MRMSLFGVQYKVFPMHSALQEGRIKTMLLNLVWKRRYDTCLIFATLVLEEISKVRLKQGDNLKSATLHLKCTMILIVVLITVAST